MNNCKIGRLVTVSLLWFIIRLDISKSVTENDVKEKGNLKTDCPFVTITQDVLSFASAMDSRDVGFSVDLIFYDFVDILEANDSNPAPAKVFEVSKTHWIVSVLVVRGDVKKAEFAARYRVNEESRDVKLVGVIYNGETLCGEGKTEVFTPKNDKYGGRKKCNWSTTSYEHESAFYLQENFYSKKIGIVVDIFFSSEVDRLDEISSIKIREKSKKHYTLSNGGYITSKEEPLKISFKVHHLKRKPPEIVAVVINNEVICGFATFVDVYKSGEADFLDSMDILAISSSIITVCALLVAIITGIFAWKLTVSKSKPLLLNEPIYSMPKRVQNES